MGNIIEVVKMFAQILHVKGVVESGLRKEIKKAPVRRLTES